jgi:hypothetical protein
MTEEMGFVPQQRQEVFSSPKPPHRLCGPPSLLCTTYRRFLPQQEKSCYVKMTILTGLRLRLLYASRSKPPYIHHCMFPEMYSDNFTSFSFIKQRC